MYLFLHNHQFTRLYQFQTAVDDLADHSIYIYLHLTLLNMYNMYVYGDTSNKSSRLTILKEKMFNITLSTVLVYFLSLVLWTRYHILVYQIISPKICLFDGSCQKILKKNILISIKSNNVRLFCR